MIGQRKVAKITNSADGGPKIVLIDFDGVFVDTQKFDLYDINGEYIPYSIPWLMELMDWGFDVRIFSARCNDESAIQVMKNWFLGKNMPQEYLGALKFEPGKPSCHIIIDDRAAQFNGDVHAFSPGFVKSFKPWNRT